MNPFKIILFIIAAIISSCGNNYIGTEHLSKTGDVTLFGTDFLQGKVKAIVYNNKESYDSLAFVYNKNGEVDKVEYHSDEGEKGYCEYDHNGSNRIDQHNYDKEGVEQSYEIVEFDDRNNITLYREYGYIFPDTTKMVLLYLKQNSYNKKGRKDNSFEYYSDGIPPYNYNYTYNDGTETEVCTLTATGDIYTISKIKRNDKGNIIEKSRNMPWDTQEWDSIKVEYKYDDKGNWIERKVTSLSSQQYLNKGIKRKIYYLDGE